MRTLMTCASRLIVMSLLGMGSACFAQGADPLARITAAADLTSMQSVNVKPWHLKLDVTVFDAQGANPQAGTVEVWHAGADERIVYTFGDATSALLFHDGKHYFRSTGTPIPAEAYQVVKEVLYPGPSAVDLAGATANVHPETFGKVAMDCIMVSQPTPGLKVVPLGLYPTYCVDKNGVIRSTYNLGGRTVVLGTVGTFEGHKVPVQLDMFYSHMKAGTAKTVALTSYVPQAGEFVPSADMKLTDDVARISGELVKPTRISFVQPVYPPNMKVLHESATVVLRGSIGLDGHVLGLSPEPSSNPIDPQFVISAIAAVSNWVYKPYLVDGEPTEADTTFTVNFALN